MRASPHFVAVRLLNVPCNRIYSSLPRSALHKTIKRLNIHFILFCVTVQALLRGRPPISLIMLMAAYENHPRTTSCGHFSCFPRVSAYGSFHCIWISPSLTKMIVIWIWRRIAAGYLLIEKKNVLLLYLYIWHTYIMRRKIKASKCPKSPLKQQRFPRVFLHGLECTSKYGKLWHINFYKCFLTIYGHRERYLFLSWPASYKRRDRAVGTTMDSEQSRGLWGRDWECLSRCQVHVYTIEKRNIVI